MTPPITLHWFLPTNGDSRQLVGGGHGLGTGSAGTIRPATIEYLTQVAQAAEQVGSPRHSPRPGRGARTRG